MLYELEGRRPRVAADCFIAPNATIIGDVTIGPGASVWFGVVIRGDVESITIGAGSNIQDGCVLHADPGSPLVIGSNVTVGHLAMLHGCTVGDGCLVGINAVVLNGAVLGEDCLVGANALLKEKLVVPAGSVVMGSPGRIVRELDAAQRAQLHANALNYVGNAQRFRAGLKAIDHG